MLEQFLLWRVEQGEQVGVVMGCLRMPQLYYLGATAQSILVVAAVAKVAVLPLLLESVALAALALSS